ncbi:hypothetical protein PA598K_00497 [Paenibacillus sp. 598K]|uniref:hypothetical protein n=1 Tax=Paenibacillus sp. 598K TaxID=1117987 RepID=UPI000FFAD97A|nr:hypothetical protein [Paenibacillus sp. 598K]GBF72259.1 hypothetical protein PA598K_00497 [Paenibacillus sp. 598K]
MAPFPSLFTGKKKPSDQDRQTAAQTQTQTQAPQQTATQTPTSPPVQGTQSPTPLDLRNTLQRSLGNRNLARSQQSSGSGSPPPSGPSKEEIRQGELDLQKDATANRLADKYFTGLQSTTATELTTFLAKDKQTAALRNSLRQAAISAVQQQVENTGSVTDQQKKDAKSYAEQLVDSQNVLGETLKKYAGSTATPRLGDTQKEKLQTKAKEGFAMVAPKPGVELSKQLKEADKSAEKQTVGEARQIGEATLTAGKQSILQDMQNDLGALSVHVDIKTLGTDEAGKRSRLENSLFDATVIDQVYKASLADPIRQVVLLKLGVGRSAFRRSDELNAFRDSLKEAGRTQARTDIDNQLDSNSLTSGKSNVGKQYYGMLAKAESHSTSKSSVDKVMGTHADSILTQLLPQEPTTKQLKEAAQTSAYSVARSHADAGDKIAKASKTGAQAKAAELYKIIMPKAESEARKVTKGDKETGAGPDLIKRSELITQVGQQVTADDIAGKAIKYVIEEDSLNKGFAKVAKIIDLAVPAAGDSASLEFELKIPIQAGAYFLISLGAEAEKEEGELSLESQVSIGGGFGGFGLDVNASVGFFLAAQGSNSHSAVNLMSYGMYRQMRKFSAGAADSLWGHGGKSGKSKLEEAELWAAMIEQQEMSNEDNHVDVGLTSQVAAEVNAGVFEAEAALGHKRLNRYDKDAVTDKAGSFGDSTDLAKLAEKATALLSGSKRRTLEFESALSLEIAGTGVDFGIALELAWMDGTLKEVEIAVEAGLPFQYGEETTEWAKTLAKLVAPISGLVKNSVGAVQNTMKDKKGASYAGTAADIGTDTLFLVPEFDAWGESFASQLQDQDEIQEQMRSWFTSEELDADELSNKIALSSTMDFSLNISAEKDDAGKFSKWEVSLEIGQTKGLEIEAGIMTLAIEKSKRLGKLALSKENGAYGLKGGLVGIEKT